MSRVPSGGVQGKETDMTKRESIVISAGRMEFIVPDGKMELVKALLFEVCSGAQGKCPPRPESV